MEFNYELMVYTLALLHPYLSNGQSLISPLSSCGEKLKQEELEILKLRQQHDKCNEKDDILFSSRSIKYLNYNKGDTVLFSDVIINKGQGYNSQTGTFTCPRAGIYMISVTLILKDPATYFNVMRNTDIIGKVYSQKYNLSDRKPYTQWVSSSLKMFIPLSFGDTVYVKSTKVAAVTKNGMFSMMSI